jgi:hypothetical protein
MRPIYVMPLDKVLDRLRRHGVGPAVLARVERLNPGGVAEGARIRGLHRKETLKRAQRHIVGPREFDAVNGKGAHRQIPPCHLVRRGGKRRGVAVESVEDNLIVLYRQPGYVPTCYRRACTCPYRGVPDQREHFPFPYC